MSTPPPPSQPELHYAPPPPLRRHRHLARWLIALTLLIALLLSSRWGPLLWRRTQALYWQRQCMTYNISPSQPVLQAIANQSPQSSVVAAPWRRLYALLSPPGLRSEGTVFLHERTSPGGHHRLVAVDLHRMTPIAAQPAMLGYSTKVFAVGALLSEPVEQPHGSNVTYFYPIVQEIRVYGGSLDSSDASHFSFRYIQGNVQGEMNLWLRDDDSIASEIRFDPLGTIPPAPSSPASPHSSDRPIVLTVPAAQ